MAVRVQEADFDVGAELAALRGKDPQIGALASFVGLVRELNDGAGVSELTLEHYPGMTERALQAIVSEACRRWAIIDALVIHRVGRLLPTDQIVLVAVAGAHRGDATLHHAQAGGAAATASAVGAVIQRRVPGTVGEMHLARIGVQHHQTVVDLVECHAQQLGFAGLLHLAAPCNRPERRDWKCV